MFTALADVLAQLEAVAVWVGDLCNAHGDAACLLHSAHGSAGGTHLGDSGVEVIDLEVEAGVGEAAPQRSRPGGGYGGATMSPSQRKVFQPGEPEPGVGSSGSPRVSR